MGSGFDVEIESHQVGIIPRAIQELFDGIRSITEEALSQGRPEPRFTIYAQFLELYNEDVIDLLDTTKDYSLAKVKSGIRIHEDAKHSIYVSGVTSKAIHSAEEALQCLRQGALSRTTASTQMNAQSSRSHAIFTLHIEQKKIIKAEVGVACDDEKNRNVMMRVKFEINFTFFFFFRSRITSNIWTRTELATKTISKRCRRSSISSIWPARNA